MKELVKRLKDSEERIINSQNTWQKKTRERIIKSLQTLRDDLDLNLEVFINDAIYNRESIYLSFLERPSGLVFNEQHPDVKQLEKKGSIIKHGASLYYSAGYRGEVIVWMSYPVIEDVSEEGENYEEIRRVKQDDIHNESIHEDFAEFIEKVVAWNNCEVKREIIGFKVR